MPAFLFAVVTKAKLLGEDVDEPQSIFELLFGGLFRDSNDGQKRRRRVKKQKVRRAAHCCCRVLHYCGVC